MPRRPNIINEQSANDKTSSMPVESEKVNMMEDIAAEAGNCDSFDQQPSPTTESRGSIEVHKTFLSDDTMQTPVSSRNGKSSRRKQTKPIRVAAFLEVEGQEGEGAEAPQNLPEADYNVMGSETAEKVNGQSITASTEQMNTDTEVNSFSCELCMDKFSNQNQLNIHIQAVHQINNEDEEMKDVNPQLFPTKYHQLGSEFQQEISRVVVATPKPVDENSRDFSTSSGQREEGERIKSSSGPPHIFHKDAYCDLCSREFCNKYFLKTHKANKHGVYEDFNGESPTSAGTTMPPLLPPLLPPTPVSSAETSPILPSPFTRTPNGPMSILVPPPAREMAVTVVPITPVPASPTEQKKATPVSTPPAVTQTSLITPGKSPNQAETPSDMEDFCEICQKHFCNKYYLKKHKQDVHGMVYPDTPTQKRPNSGFHIVSTTASPPTTLNIPTISSALPIFPTPPKDPATTMSNHAAMANLTNMNNVMLQFINPFSPPVAMISTQQAPHSSPSAFMPQGLTHLPHLPQMTGELGLIKSCAPGSMSPKNMPLPNDALRSIGVLNADAYCEICRKEFCNKYFLRIHKANKHGIYIDDSGQQIPGPMLLPVMPPTSEHNFLSMGLTGIPGIPPEFMLNIKREAEEMERLNNAGIKPEMEVNCELCNKEFANKYSLKIHKINVHNINPNESDEEGRPGTESSGASSGIPKPNDLKNMSLVNSSGDLTMPATMFGNMIAAKLADRVTCDVCNKEVCNKYFLKTHKMRVHGIDPSKLDQLSKDGVTPTPPKTPLKVPTDVKLEQVERPNTDELLKMGIDPEAYCEICKKEFCSKYFLKTHKLNIHGIKVDRSVEARSVYSQSHMAGLLQPEHLNLLTSPMNLSTSLLNLTSANSTLPSGFSSAPLNFSTAPMNFSTAPLNFSTAPLNFSTAPLMNFSSAPLNFSTAPLNLSTSPQSSTSSSSPPVNFSTAPLSFSSAPVKRKLDMAVSPSMSDAGNFPLGSASQCASELASWKWKNPMNATRVMCDLCNKELCNKYFLKTHMLNKHGITIDIGSGTVTPNNGSENGSVRAHSPTPSNEDKSKDSADVEMKLDNNRNNEKNNFHESQINSERQSGSVLAKTWHVPSEYSKENKMEISTEDIEKHMNDEEYIKKCKICGMLFGESVTLQLHMIKDHNINPAGIQFGENKTTNQATVALMSSFKRRFLGMRRKFRARRTRRLGQNGGGIADKVRSAIVNHIHNHQRKKKFRCAHCQERFSSRVLCQAHIRSEHPSVKSVDPSAYLEAERQRSAALEVMRSKASSQSQQAPPMQAHKNGGSKLPVTYGQAATAEPPSQLSYTMQAFRLKPSSGGERDSFVDAVVYLPVVQKLHNPADVTFTLTPTQQQ